MLIYVDFMPGHIGAWDVEAESLLHRTCPHEEVHLAELAAIELGLEVASGVPALILSDSIGAVKLVHGKLPRRDFTSAQWAELLEVASTIRSRAEDSVVAWIPRNSNVADRMLRRAVEEA